jgi:uncharacterized OsmC-like protein
MAENTRRSVTIERIGKGRYRLENVRGGWIEIGEGADTNFTSVELLLAAIGGCTSTDVDYLTSRRCQPNRFAVTVSGDKIRDSEVGNRMENLEVSFMVEFPEDEAGDAARDVLPRAVRRSHDRLCTVSRTVETPSPITTVVNGSPLAD